MTDNTETPQLTEPEVSAADDSANSVKVSLADLCAKGTSCYAHKNYNEAADYYARASELQAELNGEMSPENGEILFLYGRSLFKVGQSKSDVLGGRAAGEKKKSNGSAKPKQEPAPQAESVLERITEEGVALAAERNGAEGKKEEDGPKKPLFQFTGDENFEDSEQEDEDGEEEEEEEEDDLAAAFEVLDLARVLFTRRLEQPEESNGKGKEVGDSDDVKHIKERLADIHDLLAEISLENERFPNAVSDFRSSLAYKQELFTKDNEIIAEAHFKLSLALEFASITTTKDDEETDAPTDAPKETQIDEAMREEAAKQLEAAIESTELKLQNKEVDLASSANTEDNDITRKQIAEVKEIVADMQQRLLDLRAPPVDVNAALNGPTGADPRGGVLGAALGESPAEAQTRIDEAKKTATDLTGLVRRKAKVENGAVVPATNGKRKAEEEPEVAVEAKKAKVEDAEEE